MFNKNEKSVYDELPQSGTMLEQSDGLPEHRADKHPDDDGGCSGYCSLHKNYCHLVPEHHSSHWCEGGANEAAHAF